MLRSLYDFFHSSDWLTFSSRNIKTFELSDKSCTTSMNESFFVLIASFIYLVTIFFRISFMIFRITTILCVINDETSNSIIREYTSNISKMKINLFESIESLIVLNVICSVRSSWISRILVVMMLYTRLSNSWYRSITFIEWCVSIEMFLTFMLILVAYCLNSRVINYVSTLTKIKSSDSR
jgi:hypothetical protein